MAQLRMASRILVCTLVMVQPAVGKMVDMTHEFNNRSMHYPNAPDFQLKPDYYGYYDSFGGIWIEAYNMVLNEHTGTHVDAPSHMGNHKGGRHMSEVPLEDLIGPAVVIDVKEQGARDRDYALQIKDLFEFEKKHGRIPGGAFIFLDTDGAKDYWNRPAYTGGEIDALDARHFPGFGIDSLQWLIDNRNIKGIGNDRLSFDTGQNIKFDCHLILLSHGKIGIENANNVNKLPPVGATVLVMPLPTKGGSGSPARIVAFWDTNLPIYSSAQCQSISAFVYSLLVTLIALHFSCL